jgi:hypothetical protein
MITAARPIANLDELRNHLQLAIGVELTTIPAYLCGLYTIDEGCNTAAYEVIQSVVLEEMLHVCLAGNVLNAIGGKPSPDPLGAGPSPVPTYPADVPFIRLPTIHLQPFSPAALDNFMAIEYPDAITADPDHPERYDSIGAFYAAIETGLRELCSPDVFAAAIETCPGYQLTPPDYYGGAGALIEVVDLDSALAAVTEIAREGEGAPAASLNRTAKQHMADGGSTPGRLNTAYSVDDLDRLPFGWKMYSHYARFAEIRAGRYYQPDQNIGERPAGDILPTDWRATRPMVIDPKADDYVGTAAHRPMDAFNRTYTDVIKAIYQSLNGYPQTLRDAVHTMYTLKYQALSLLNMPSPLDPKRTLGPAFEYLA